jgi:outer membrane receptor protein involved in Fe transport
MGCLPTCYFNGSVTYALPGSMSNWKLFMNVNNILNTSPPIDPLNLYIPQAVSTGVALHAPAATSASASGFLSKT